jgi:OmpR-family two-component system manganese-sensing sensor histidine kinase
MLDIIRRRLVFLYTFTTGLILTGVLILILLFSRLQLLKSKRENFQNNYFSISKNVQIDNVISHLTLSEFEVKNNLIIHIEENGIPLKYEGAAKYQTKRNILIEKIKKLGLKDNINTNIRPSSTSELKSKIYKLKGEKKELYYGAIFMVPTQRGYRTLVILQYISQSLFHQYGYGILFLLLDAMEICSCYIISRWVVGKSLRQVEESRRRQNKFIAAASHELKSPLSVIQANASALRIEPERTEQFTKGIEAECRRLKCLIEDMLLLAMADANSWDISKESVDMDILIIEMYDLYYSLFKQQQKELKLELQDEMLPKIKGDTLRIRQIIAALIDNALTYTDAGSTVILKSYTKKSQLWIEVIDNGKGIKLENKSEIFERFFREDTSRNNKSHFGLGLSIARELVTLHGGNITVEDTIGGGATFKFYLPVDISYFGEKKPVYNL